VRQALAQPACSTYAWYQPPYRASQCAQELLSVHDVASVTQVHLCSSSHPRNVVMALVRCVNCKKLTLKRHDT
jgi:hypothetical protein